MQNYLTVTSIVYLNMYSYSHVLQGSALTSHVMSMLF